MELKSHEKVSVLFVDDEEYARELTARLLRWKGLTVLTAVDGEEGLRLFRRHRPDIIVTDIIMPNMDGIRMSREVRRICAGTPIIIASANFHEQQVAEINDIGVYSCLQKPIELARLVRDIETCCSETGFLPKGRVF
jgi:CheY-like chemotaxis protein